MKYTQHLTSTLVTCALAVAMVTSAVAQTAVEGAAKVIRIKGPARFTTGNNVWQPLKVGTVLKPGALVQTRPFLLPLVLPHLNLAFPAQGALGCLISRPPNKMSSGFGRIPLYPSRS
jgi:hypothetical protein